jgi:hypothetical protein
VSETPDDHLANDRTSSESRKAFDAVSLQVPEDKGDSSGDPGPFGPRADVRRELRVEVDPKLWRLVGRLRRDLDMSASGIVRAAIRELATRLYGPGALR